MTGRTETLPNAVETQVLRILDEPGVDVAQALDRACERFPKYEDTIRAAFGEAEFVGPYRLLREIGSGGMGSVHEAVHRETGQRAAVKLIRWDQTLSPELLERFRREARLTNSIEHPRCVSMYGTGEHDGQPYIAMELLSGETLDGVVRRDGPLSLDRALRTAIDITECLAEAHRQSIIHRDVSPKNCFLDHHGRVKLGDFGISKSTRSEVRLTQTGQGMGTIGFASPEQLRGRRVDHRTDIYSTAATLFFLLVGRAPFQRASHGASMAAALQEEPPDVSDCCAQAPRGLDAVVRRGLAVEVADRYPDMQSLGRELRAFLV